MPRWSALATCTLLAAAGAAACASDPIAPAESLAPGTPSRLVTMNAYQGTVIPIEYGTRINASGAVVGNALDGHVAYYQAGVVTRLAMPAGYGLIELPTLSDDDRIAVTGIAPPHFHAFMYSSPTAVPYSITGTLDSEVEGMSGEGVVIGKRVAVAGGGERPFRWSATTGLMDLTPPHAVDVILMDISSDGYVVGGLNFEQNGVIQSLTYYVWPPRSSSGVVMPVQYQPLQVLPGGSVLASSHAGSVIWSPSGVRFVGPAPGTMSVTRMNRNGRYVGWTRDPSSGQGRAWTSFGTGPATILPIPAGATASSANDVNACGTILGSVTLSTGVSQAIVWSKPLACDPPVVATP